MQRPTQLDRSVRHTGVKVTSMCQALLHSEIKPHMSLLNQNKINSISNYYRMHNYLTAPQYHFIYTCYFNFVLNGFVDVERRPVTI